MNVQEMIAKCNSITTRTMLVIKAYDGRVIYRGTAGDRNMSGENMKVDCFYMNGVSFVIYTE